VFENERKILKISQNYIFLNVCVMASTVVISNDRRKPIFVIKKNYSKIILIIILAMNTAPSLHMVWWDSRRVLSKRKPPKPRTVLRAIGP